MAIIDDKRKAVRVNLQEKIYGLTPPKNEEERIQQEIEKEERIRSLEIETPPNGNLDKETVNTLGTNMAKAVVGTRPVNEERDAQKTDTKKEGDAEESKQPEPELPNSLISEALGQVDNDILKKRVAQIKLDLNAAGFDANEEDVYEILNSNFKVKFPWGPIAINLSKGLNDIVGASIASFFTLVGLGAASVGSLVPVIGTLLGGAVAGVGLGFTILFIFTSILLTLLAVYLKFRYLNNASDSLAKAGFMRRKMYRYFTRRVWRWIFGGAIPLVGWLLNIFENILTWRYLKKTVKEIQEIVESTM
jgi:hypothetical protein